MVEACPRGEGRPVLYPGGCWSWNRQSAMKLPDPNMFSRIFQYAVLEIYQAVDIIKRHLQGEVSSAHENAGKGIGHILA
jgi:hypothetical protein